MRRWQQPSRQHDATDFFLHMHQVLHAPCVQGLWQSYDSDRTLRDEGGVCPLILSGLRDMVSAPLTPAQSHINLWSSRGINMPVCQVQKQRGCSSTVLTSAMNSALPACWTDHRIHADPDILIPQRSSISGVIWGTYQRRAIVQHLGPSTVSGHYCAELKPSGDHHQHWHHTDDAKPATLVLPSSLGASNYLLIYPLRSAAAISP